MDTNQLEALVVNEGERYLPKPESYSAAMHLGHMASYREALRYSYGKRVLDLGCGTGYGAFFLAYHGATKVTAVDFGQIGLQYARQVYAHSNLSYLRANGLDLPFPDNSFDFVFSSQVIEHVSDVDRFLGEIKRVLTSSGVCLITTPNLKLFSPQGETDNPHHLNEMNWETYSAKINKHFAYSEFQGIYQNCLQITPDGRAITKPNDKIFLEDFVPRDYELDECENMLAWGRSEALQKPDEVLPHEINQVIHELRPLFWDSTLSKWIVLGYYAQLDKLAPQILKPAQRHVYQTMIPVKDLCRLDIELDQIYDQHLQICLSVGTEILKEEIIDGPIKTITIRFRPLAVPPPSSLMMAITPAGKKHWWEKRSPLILSTTSVYFHTSNRLTQYFADRQMAIRAFYRL